MIKTHINNRYLLKSKLGAGGMGVVHLALDRLTREAVALKQIHISSEKSSSDLMDDGSLPLSLAQEFQVLASLRHPNIISVIDYGFDRDHNPFFTMTYLPEKRNILVAGSELSLSEKADLIRQMLQALAYLHRRKIYHQDIKPDNVLVHDGRLRLLDFGLASIRSNQPIQSSGGTLAYRAPELWLGEAYTEAADLFAVGVIAFELLTGRHPFAPIDSFLLDRVLENEPNWNELNGKVKNFKPFLAKLLAKSPNKRYQNVSESLKALNQAVTTQIGEEAIEIRESYLQAATFVGRKAEMNALIGALDHTKSRAAKVVLVGGESGVGKSRLLNELRSHALVGGWQVLVGQAVSNGNLPYQLWQEVVPKLVLNQPIDDLAAGVLRQIVPNIAPLVGKDVPNPAELQGVAYKQRIVHALVSLLQQQTVPTLLLLEDLQWDIESLEPIQQLLKVAETLPKLVVIGTFRNDERPDMQTLLPGSRLLELNRLLNDQISELCQNILGSEIATPKIIELLAKQTEGNTFFIVEVMRALAEEAGGNLENIVDNDLPSDILTIGMQTLLQRRIEKIPPADQALLHLAAVAGRTLDLKLLTELFAETETQSLENWLQRVSDAAVITIHDNEWRFSHDKLRETIVHQLNHEVSVATHKQVAEALERLYPGRSELHGALLEHWSHIGDFDKEYFYLTSIVDRMIRLTADYRSASALIERSLSKLPDNDDRLVSLWNWLSSTSWRQGDYENALLFGEKALSKAMVLNDRPGIATSLRELGTVAHQQGNYKTADQHYQDALRIWIQLEDKKETGRIYSLIGSLNGAQGNFSEAKEYLNHSLAIRKKNQDQYYTASVLTNLGMVAFFQEEYEDAKRLYQQSLNLSRKIGDLFGNALNLNNLGSVQYHQGEFTEAQGTYEESLSIYRKVGQQNGVIMCLINLGFVYLRQENRAARGILREALVGAHQANIKPFVMELVVGFAWYHFQQEELDKTWQLIELAKAKAEQYVDVQIRLDELLPLLAHVSPINFASQAESSQTEFQLDSMVNHLIKLHQD